MAANDRTYIVFLGPPGSGKGTQAKILEKGLGLPQVATGDLFRYNLKNQTALGLLAKKYMDAGELVPDEVTIRMVEERLAREDCARGAILDGFPRNLHQAVALDEILAPYGGVAVAPLFVVDDAIVVERISGRRICRNCGAVYHVTFNPPKRDGVCDVCGGELYQRDDDRPETVKNRLYVYYKQTSPLIGYYFAKGLLAEIDASKSVDEVTAALEALLAKRGIA
ncbi:MAG TPA: adenylate kinase [Anaerolineae bacterium]|nr:adenylate kinase [Anaerolineae bacterium]HIQ12243.1 adenylate kinase [Caldilineales bacterium]